MELYGLSATVREADVKKFLLKQLKSAANPIIRWLDDAHALLIFSKKQEAEELLTSEQPCYKIRPYNPSTSLLHDLSSIGKPDS